MNQGFPIRCLVIYSANALPDENQWLKIIQVSRPLFECQHLCCKEFYYFTNHKDYNCVQLSKIFDLLYPCLNQIEYLGFHFPEHYPTKFFVDLDWPQLPKLRQLHLIWMKIPISGINTLAEGFVCFPNLELLNLHNSVTEIVQNDQELPGSHIIAEHLPKLNKLKWLGVGGNHINRSGLEKLIEAISCLDKMNKIWLNGNDLDGETIEMCLMGLRHLPELHDIDFFNSEHNFESLAEKKAFKFHVLRPFHCPNAFPSLQQLRFTGSCYQLNGRIDDDPEHENVEEAIRNGIKQIRPYCTVEF